MSQSYFSSQDSIAKLLHVVGKWEGTPWAANSAAKGFGVSCHNLPRSVYIECGALADSFPVITGDPAKDKHAKTSRMVEFLDGRPEFRRVREQPVPGDLIGIRIYRNVDHLGIVLPNNSFAHVLMHKNTCIDLLVSPWLERVGAVWRIEA